MDPQNTRVRIASLLSSIADSAKEQSPVKESDKATCRPYNADDFAARVETFKVTTWFNKPKELSALQCARFGWINSKEDTLTCITCRAVLNCRVDASLEPSSTRALVAKFTSQLKERHMAWCPWRTNYCKQDMAEPPLEDHDTERARLWERRKSILALQHVPPARIRESTLKQLRDLEAYLQGCMNAAEGKGSLGTASATQLLLALTGWISDQQPSRMVRTLKCSLCTRTCAVWNFDHVTEDDIFGGQRSLQEAGRGGGGANAEELQEGQGKELVKDEDGSKHKADATGQAGAEGMGSRVQGSSDDPIVLQQAVDILSGTRSGTEGGTQDDGAMDSSRWALPLAFGTRSRGAQKGAASEEGVKQQQQQQKKNKKTTEGEQKMEEKEQRQGGDAGETANKDHMQARKRAAKALSTGPRFGQAARGVGTFLFGLNFRFNPQAVKQGEDSAEADDSAGKRRHSDASAAREKEEGGGESGGEPLSKRSKAMLKTKTHASTRWGAFNPVTSHRPYCVWSNPQRSAQLLRLIMSGNQSGGGGGGGVRDLFSDMSPARRTSSAAGSASTSATTSPSSRLEKAKAALEAVRKMLK